MNNKVNPVEVQESAGYENCVGHKEQASVLDFFGIPEEELPTYVEDNWKKHWTGMPEFKQEDNPPYMKIYISFRNEADYKEFAKLVDQNLTEKTKSIWYPKLDRDENSLKRWVETDD